MVTRFIFCGGGTGGHIFPGIAIAMAIRKKVPESAILFVGTHRGLEETLLPRYGFKFSIIKSAGFKNVGLLKKIKALLIIPAGILQSISLIKSFKPQVVVGLGGYSAFPMMIAATLKRTYRCIQEQNAIPGLTNRILAPFAHRIFVSFETTTAYFSKTKTIVSGNPIREGLCTQRDISAHVPVRNILILGGSLGAHFINNLCIVSLPALLSEYSYLEVYIQTGSKDLTEVQKAFETYGNRVCVSAFIDDIKSAYEWADIVVARAGATTLAELAVCGIPAILIPFPYAANDHQTENARFFSSRGGAILLKESEIEKEKFKELLTDLIINKEKVHSMSENMKNLGHPEAADTIASSLLSLTISHTSNGDVK